MNNQNVTTMIPAELQEQMGRTRETFCETIAATTLEQISEQQLQCWVKLLVCSDFVERQFIHHKQAIALQWEAGLYHRSLKADEMAQLLTEALQTVESEQQLYQVLRQFRNQQMVRICWRDINELAALNEVLTELTELANCSIRQALDWLEKKQQGELGVALDSQGNSMPLIVIGMGKLGAYELNFSSDVDLIFVFSEHGQTVNGPRSISHNEYFIKLGQRLIRALDQQTADGFVFRVDMRLRPFGQSGPLVVTYDALEGYYTAHGREWERYALIKARTITGTETDRDYLRSLLIPFVYRRYIDFSVFESLREMKSMIAYEVKQKKKEHNVKLGAGGIREIEFLAQAFQLLRGGRDKRLQERQVQKVLVYLGEQNLLPEFVVSDLLHAYDFLRRTEHRIQQINDQQTHNLPDSDYLRARIAYGMGYADWDSFAEDLQAIRNTVQNHFEQLFQAPQAQDGENEEDEVQGIWLVSLSDEHSAAILNELGYSDGKEIVRLLKSFRDSHHYKKMSKEGSIRLDRLIPLILKSVAGVENSEITFKRIMEVIESICRRSVYLSLLVENPLGLSQLVKLCSASSWITRLLSHHPALFDELLDPRILYAPLNREHLFKELEARMQAIPLSDLEQRMEVLRYFKQSHVLRVAAADVTNIIPLMKVSDYLTWIAEVILHFVLQTAWHDMLNRYGEPQIKDQTAACSDQSPPFGSGFFMLGFGKLGGIELGYSSDLDMVFLFSDAYNGGMTNTQGYEQSKVVDNLQFFSRLSLRIMHILQTQTPAGTLYEADMRLRPNGNSGLIVNSFKAFKEYELEKAWTWEHQALVRARFVGGDERLITDYQNIRQEILGLKRDAGTLQQEVRDMRSKMRQSLTKKLPGIFDIKQGHGGIADIEFMVQYLVLKNAAQHPQLLKWTDNIRILETLAETGILAPSAVDELSRCYRQFRARLHQLSLQEVSGVVAEDEFKQQRSKIQQYWQEIMQ